MPHPARKQPSDDDVRRAENEFALERAKTINAYAELEQALAGLFHTLLGADVEKSYFIFSKIINARSRREILEELVYIASGNSYKLFFGTLMNLSLVLKIKETISFIG